MMTTTYIFGMLFKAFWLFAEQILTLVFLLQDYDDLQNSAWAQVLGLVTCLAVLAVMAMKYMAYKRSNKD